MNDELWKRILEFDLDGILSEYGFTTRLENENYWTEGFARGAITEYKKFMYLAAVSDSMVSPSVIVDVVWHQHLIFTQSYDDFCAVLGKKVLHLPSTHQSSDVAQFKTAKETTSKHYQEYFGPQPAEFWNYNDIYGPLALDRSRFGVQDVVSIGILSTLLCILLGYLFLLPLYVTIENPDFLIGYGAMAVVSILGLNIYNRVVLSKIVQRWPKQAFIFNLSALELIYLSKNQIRAVINGVTNRLIIDKKITISSDQRLCALVDAKAENVLELCVLQTISTSPGVAYQTQLFELERKPAFNKTARAMDGFYSYFTKSKPFIRLFLLNFAVLSVVFVLGAVRLTTGIVRDKPINQILTAMVVCLVVIVAHLLYLSKAIGMSVLPKYYKNNILPTNPTNGQWDWEYFLLGTAVFDYSFSSLATSGNFNNTSNSSDSSSCGSAGDSGGGDSGGGSCGGCGSS